MKMRAVTLFLCMLLLFILVAGCGKENAIKEEVVVENVSEEIEVGEVEALTEDSTNLDETHLAETSADIETESVEEPEGPIGEATEVIYTMEEDDLGYFEDSKIGSIGTSKFAMWLYQNLKYDYPHFLVVKENRDVIDIKEGESYRLEETDKIYIWPTSRSHIPDSIRRENEVLDENNLVCFPQLTEINVPGDDINAYYDGPRNGDFSRHGVDTFILLPNYSQFESPQKVSVTSFTTTGEHENRTTTVYLYAPGTK